MKFLKYSAIVMVTIVFTLVIFSFIGRYAVSQAFIKELKSPYDFEKTIEVLERNIENREGWKIINVVDQQQTLLAAGERDIYSFKIIKFCNAKFASQMLSPDKQKFFGVVMPISMAVYEKSDGRVFISVINGKLLTALFGGEINRINSKVRLDVEQMLAFTKNKL